MTTTETLGEVLEIRKGKKAAAVVDSEVAGSFPYIQINEVRGVKPSKFAIDSKPVLATENDLCIVWVGANAGMIGYGVNGAVGSTIARMRVKNPREWDTRFLGRLLEGKFSQLNQEAQGRGATIPHVDKARLEAIELPKKPLSQQRRIAAILDKAEAVRRKREQVLALAEDFLKSAFLEMFGRPGRPKQTLTVRQLGQLCDLFTGNSLPVGEPYLGHGHGLLLLKVGDLSLPGNDHIIVNARKWVPAMGRTGTAVVAPKEAIVFPKRGRAIATNRKRILGRPCILDPNVMAAAPKTGAPISYPYLRVWFELLDLTSVSNGSTVPQLNKGDLRPLEIPIPSNDDLLRFDRLFHGISKLLKMLLSDLNSAEILFSALYQRAFSGEL
jgi:type I restriction enzyme S subunit